ncbi:hypothetical protein [Piscinibacter koreensis]|nr:hypothetical protein [Schlegelella koreensis]
MKTATRRWLGGVAAVAVLAAVFASYLQPELVVELATQVWNCF